MIGYSNFGIYWQNSVVLPFIYYKTSSLADGLHTTIYFFGFYRKKFRSLFNSGADPGFFNGGGGGVSGGRGRVGGGGVADTNRPPN